MQPQPIKKILIANRGEIAVRIIKTCQRLGIATVAVYSEADASAPHVRRADESYLIGPAHVTESYLNQDKILEVAKEAGVDALHPGYGLLSENASFARKVHQAGIRFIGPNPETMELMGDKSAARHFAQQASVPVVPGSANPIATEEEAIAFAQEFGYPILVKAAAGGGGIGMQVAHKEKALIKAIATCQRRAQSSFGDDTIYLERYIEDPRHLEVQVLADSHGNVVHLFERECSIQRRHQKVIEEAPSPASSTWSDLRERLTSAAIALTKKANYVNAGTIEFILAPDGTFYFIEMNTRLQVEHPVTEAITGIDIVEQQINIAAGFPLPFEQSQIQLNGHAIESRIYAENPDRGFIPAPGVITEYVEPTEEDVRVDSSIDGPTTITPYYDPMIAKVTAHGTDRSGATQTLTKALETYTIEGLTTNLEMHIKTLQSQDFINATFNTTWLEDFVKNKT